MGGELYHGEIGDVHEVLEVVVALIYREAFLIELTLSYFAQPIWD